MILKRLQNNVLEIKHLGAPNRFAGFAFFATIGWAQFAQTTWIKMLAIALLFVTLAWFWEMLSQNTVLTKTDDLLTITRPSWLRKQGKTATLARSSLIGLHYNNIFRNSLLRYLITDKRHRATELSLTTDTGDTIFIAAFPTFPFRADPTPTEHAILDFLDLREDPLSEELTRTTPKLQTHTPQ